MTHKVDIGLDGSIPACDCGNFRLKGIPCPEACALIIRLGLDPCHFVRGCLKVQSGLRVIENGLGETEMPNIIKSSLSGSDPNILPPLLQPPPGRPSKKRKTRESVRRAHVRSLSRKRARVKTSRNHQTNVEVRHPELN